MVSLAGRTIALAVTGSIAAYKAVEVARLCVLAGAKVLPVMTRSAEKFVGAVTLSGIAGAKAARDMWDPSFSGEMHVAIGDQADAVVIVPATADVLARLAHGRADDLVTALALVARGPVLCAPAMHPRMWAHPATQRNVARLVRDARVTLVGPVDGPVASGDSGTGRMAEPAAIVEELARMLARAADRGSSRDADRGANRGAARRAPEHDADRPAVEDDGADREAKDGIAPANERSGARDLAGRVIVVSAGPTVEDLDPVRFLGNRSTGKMGFAVAERAASRGAAVHLVTGPVSLATPRGVARIDVRSAREMQAAIARAAEGADAIVMSAAVADYRPRDVSATKIKKPESQSEGETSTLDLVKNPDILAGLGRARGEARRPVLVGFAVETGDDDEVVANARKKLARKRVDLVVANAAGDAFGGDDNRAALVTADRVDRLPTMSKRELADRILDAVRGAADASSEPGPRS